MYHNNYFDKYGFCVIFFINLINVILLIYTGI